MSKEKPLYLGSWKGRVIRAIAIDGARTWNEIREFTGLSPKSLNRTLAELMNAKALEKQIHEEKATYRVSYNLYKEYEKYFNAQAADKISKKVSVKKEVQDAIVQWIGNWIQLNEKKIDLAPGHFFLEGMDFGSFYIVLIFPFIIISLK